VKWKEFSTGDGVVERADVDGARASTVDGIQVGDSEAQTRRVYEARRTLEPHQHTGPEGHYLTIPSDNGKLGIRFETDKGKIARFYAGQFEAVQYVEGCS
jgi:hypothetical protein